MKYVMLDATVYGDGKPWTLPGYVNPWHYEEDPNPFQVHLVSANASDYWRLQIAKSDFECPEGWAPILVFLDYNGMTLMNRVPGMLYLQPSDVPCIVWAFNRIWPDPNMKLQPPKAWQLALRVAESRG